MGYRAGAQTDYIGQFAAITARQEQGASDERWRAAQAASDAVRMSRENRGARRDMMASRMQGMQTVANIFTQHAKIQMEREQLITDRTQTMASIEQAKAKMRLEDDAVQISRQKLQLEANLGVRKLVSEVLEAQSRTRYNMAIASQAHMNRAMNFLRVVPELMGEAQNSFDAAEQRIGRGWAGSAQQLGIAVSATDNQMAPMHGSLPGALYSAGNFSEQGLSAHDYASSYTHGINEEISRRLMEMRVAMVDPNDPAGTLPALDRIPVNKRQDVIRNVLTENLMDRAAQTAISSASPTTRNNMVIVRELARKRRMGEVELSDEDYKAMPDRAKKDGVWDKDAGVWRFAPASKEAYTAEMEWIASHLPITTKGSNISFGNALDAPSAERQKTIHNLILTSAISSASAPDLFEAYADGKWQRDVASENLANIGTLGTFSVKYIREIMAGNSPGALGLNWSPGATVAMSGVPGDGSQRALVDLTNNEINELADQLDYTPAPEGLPSQPEDLGAANPGPESTGASTLTAEDWMGALNDVASEIANGAKTPAVTEATKAGVGAYKEEERSEEIRKQGFSRGIGRNY